MCVRCNQPIVGVLMEFADMKFHREVTNVDLCSYRILFKVINCNILSSLQFALYFCILYEFIIFFLLLSLSVLHVLALRKEAGGRRVLWAGGTPLLWRLLDGAVLPTVWRLQGSSHRWSHWGLIFTIETSSLLLLFWWLIWKALGKNYHPNHFCCFGCGMDLRGKVYKEHQGDPFCDTCKLSRCDSYFILKFEAKTIDHSLSYSIHTIAQFHFIFKKPLLFLHFLDHTFSFFYSLFPFLSLSFTLSLSVELVAPDVLECNKCYKPIFGLYIKIEGKYYHPEHFKCFSCGVDASGGNSHDYQGLRGGDLFDFNGFVWRLCVRVLMFYFWWNWKIMSIYTSNFFHLIRIHDIIPFSLTPSRRKPLLRRVLFTPTRQSVRSVR